MKNNPACKSFFVIFSIFLISCSKDQLQNKKIKIEKITRNQNDVCINQDITLKKLPPYSFEEGMDKFSKITKEYFRCQGNPLNPERIDESDPDNIKVYLDCQGSSKHSLPIINSDEGVYPQLIDILNYIQKKTKKRVIITCAHRCPTHNSYADFFNNDKFSKHMIGAEVDFYVEGMEHKPLEVTKTILQYFKEKQKYKESKEYDFFEDTKSNLKNPILYNKEVKIRIYDFDEGRDFSNRHPYPYICLEVLYDKDKKEKVAYSWEKANKGFLQF